MVEIKIDAEPLRRLETQVNVDYNRMSEQILGRIGAKIVGVSQDRYFNGRPNLNTITGDLKGSMTHRMLGHNAVAVGPSNIVYGPIHEFGGMAGPGRKVRIPARPYLSTATEDVLTTMAHVIAEDVILGYVRKWGAT